MDLSRARDTDGGARVTSSLSLARGPDGKVARPPVSGEHSSSGLAGSSGRWTRELSSKRAIFCLGPISMWVASTGIRLIPPRELGSQTSPKE
jgi:hypothetical protein